MLSRIKKLVNAMKENLSFLTKLLLVGFVFLFLGIFFTPLSHVGAALVFLWAAANLFNAIFTLLPSRVKSYFEHGNAHKTDRKTTRPNNSLDEYLGEFEAQLVFLFIVGTVLMVAELFYRSMLFKNFYVAWIVVDLILLLSVVSVMAIRKIPNLFVELSKEKDAKTQNFIFLTKILLIGFVFLFLGILFTPLSHVGAALVFLWAAANLFNAIFTLLPSRVKSYFEHGNAPTIKTNERLDRETTRANDSLSEYLGEFLTQSVFLFIVGLVLVVAALFYRSKLFLYSSVAWVAVDLVLCGLVVSILIIREITIPFVELYKEKIDMERLQIIRRTTEPEVIYGSVESYIESGMEDGPTLYFRHGSAVPDRSKFDTFSHYDHLKIYNNDGSVLWEGIIDFSYSTNWLWNWFRRKINKRWREQSQQDVNHKTWSSWFQQNPSLRAELTRYTF